MARRKGISSGTLIGLVVILAAGWFFFGDSIGLSALQAAGGGTTDQPIVVSTVGESSTLYLNALDRESATNSPVTTARLYAYDNGATLLNAETATQINTAVGSTVDIYGYDVGNSSYYVDPVLGYEIGSRAPTLTLDCHQMSARTDASITAFDSDLNALTAETVANKSTDYDFPALGASQEKIVYVKFTNNVADKLYKMGAICTFADGNITSLKLDEDGWSQVTIPEEVSTSTLNHDTLETGGREWRTDSYDFCYAPDDGSVDFTEWDEQTFTF